METIETLLGLSNINHQIRSELTILMGFARFLMMEDLTANQHGAINNILEIAEHLSFLVNNILTEDKNKEKKRVLLVEDNQIIRFIHQKMLEMLGCEVDVVSDAEDALLRVTNKHHLILLDIGLPGMSGVELATELRKLEITQNARIVFLTAQTDQKTRQDCINAGIEEIFTKPISLEKLRFLINCQSPLCECSNVNIKDRLIEYEHK